MSKVLIAVLVIGALVIGGIVLYVTSQPAAPALDATSTAPSEAAGIAEAIGGSIANVANQLIRTVDESNRRAGEAAAARLSTTAAAPS